MNCYQILRIRLHCLSPSTLRDSVHKAVSHRWFFLLLLLFFSLLCLLRFVKKFTCNHDDQAITEIHNTLREWVQNLRTFYKVRKEKRKYEKSGDETIEKAIQSKTRKKK